MNRTEEFKIIQEEFEFWARNRGLPIASKNGKYFDQQTQLLFDAWRGGRESNPVNEAEFCFDRFSVWKTEVINGNLVTEFYSEIWQSVKNIIIPVNGRILPKSGLVDKEDYYEVIDGDVTYRLYPVMG